MEAIFPTVEQLFSIFVDELPEGVYAQDRADDPDTTKRSYSSSEIRAHAQLFANMYSNLKDINDDKFLTTVTVDGLPLWEKDLFKKTVSSLLTFDQRKQNALNALRAKGAINEPAITEMVAGILDPLGLTFNIVPWNGCGVGSPRAWILDITALDVWTIIVSCDPLLGAGRGMGITPLGCSNDYAAAGITLDQLNSIRETAYTYELQIYGVADSVTLQALDDMLTAKEPARSTHVIRNNAPPVGSIAP